MGCLAPAHHFVFAGVRFRERPSLEGGKKGGSSADDHLLLPMTVPEVRRLLYRLLVVARVPREEEVLAWSSWRRRHQLRAKRCHYRRRGATLEENSQG
jgi:hypothetical protein